MIFETPYVMSIKFSAYPPAVLTRVFVSFKNTGSPFCVLYACPKPPIFRFRPPFPIGRLCAVLAFTSIAHFLQGLSREMPVHSFVPSAAFLKSAKIHFGSISFEASSDWSTLVAAVFLDALSVPYYLMHWPTTCQTFGFANPRLPFHAAPINVYVVGSLNGHWAPPYASVSSSACAFPSTGARPSTRDG